MMPIEAPASTLRTDTTIEVGYKGQISDKTTLAVDVYQMNIENFTAIRQLSPLVVLPTLHTDIQAAVSPVVAGALMAQGMDPATAAFTAGLVGGAYAQVALGITGGGKDSNMLYLNGTQAHKLKNSEILSKVVSQVEKKAKEIEKNK